MKLTDLYGGYRTPKDPRFDREVTLSDMLEKYRITPARKNELYRKISYVMMLNRAERIFDDRTSWTCLTYRVFWSRGCLREYIVLSNDQGSISARRSEGNSLHAILRELGKIIDGGYYAESEYFEDLLRDKEWELDIDGEAYWA